MITSQYVSQIGLKQENVLSFDSYPFSLPAVRMLESLELHPSVTFFVGENGSGKSTLLEAIAVACGFNAVSGALSGHPRFPHKSGADDAGAV